MDYKKLDLLRVALSSQEGWQQVAKSIKYSDDPVNSKEECLKLFKQLCEKNFMVKLTDDNGQTFEVPQYDLLVASLDKMLEIV